MHIPEHPHDSTVTTFAAFEWQGRLEFKAYMTEACDKLGVKLSWLSNNWIAKLERDGQVRYAIGYVFPLNPASSGHIARDKVATYEVLSDAGLPIVEHRLLRFPSDRSSQGALDITLANTRFPLVVKPNTESVGRDVYRVYTKRKLATILTELASHYRAVAISPLEEIIEEYRVVMLQGRALLYFRKVRPTDANGKLTEWRHNLSRGATPDVVAPAVQAELLPLARQAMETIGLQLGAVDIIQTPEGLKIIEVNSGCSITKVGRDPRFTAQAKEVYTAIITACFAH